MRHSFWVFLPLCLLGSLLTAMVFLIAADAGAAREPGSRTDTFGGSGMIPVVVPIAVVLALVVWPFVYFALRYTNLDRSLPLVYLFTMTWSGVLAYWLGPPALLLTFVGFGASLVFCWKSPWARHGASVEG